MSPPKGPPLPPGDAPIELNDDADIVEISDGDDIISLDNPLDLPGPELVDMPAPLPMDGTATVPTPTRGPEISLDLDDLPAPSHAAASHDEPTRIGVPPPGPAAPVLMPMPDDLPAAIDLSNPIDSTAPSLAGVDAPSLMDDLSTADGGHAPQPGGDPSMIELTDSGAGLDLAGDTPAAQRSTVASPAATSGHAPEPSGAPSKTFKKKRRRGVRMGLAGSAIVAGLGAVAVMYWPPAAALWTAAMDKINPPPPAPPAPKVVAKPAAPAPEAPVVKAPPPAPKTVLVELTPGNVDTLGYAQLSASVADTAQRKTDKESRGLVLWAHYRLATAFDDEKARAAMVQAIAEKPDPTIGPFGAAAYAGAALSFGKPPQVKHALDRLKGPVAKTPQAQFVLAQMLAKKRAAPKALALAEKALSDAPRMVDAQFLRAELLLGKKEHSEATRLLVAVSKDGEPDTVARAATLLERADELTAMEEVLGYVKDPATLADASPLHRDELARLLVRKSVRSGNLATAVQVAQDRAGAAPENAVAAIELARLTSAQGGDGVKVLGDARAKMTDPESIAHVLYEQARLGIASKNDAAVQDALKNAVALPPHAARGWMKMAEGAVAEHDQQLGVAKADYLEASKWKPTFEEPHLALALDGVVPGSPQELAALGKLAHKITLPQLHYRLALALEAKADFAAAAKELDHLLWNDPTVIDPIELLLHYYATLDRAGEALRANTLAETLSTARSDDDRPPLAIIDMALRGKRYEIAIKWYNALLARHPNHRAYTVALANTLVDAGKAPDAQKVLDAQIKADPQAIDDEFLYTQARAWMQQDVVKARGFLMTAINKHPQAKAYLLLAELEQSRGKGDDAIQAYRDAVAMDPTLIAVRLKLVRNMVQKNFTKEAVIELEDILRHSPREADAAELLGDVLRENGQPKEALAAYVKANGVRGDKAPLLLKMARLELQELNQLPAAVKTFKRAVKADPRNPEATYYLGYALRDIGKVGEAKAALQAYLRLAPQGEFASEVQQDLESMTKH